MAVQQTEKQHPLAVGLDARPALTILQQLADAQVEAAGRVKEALPALAEAAEAAARSIAAGGRLVYAAAGSSGLMALADALELPGTFGIPRDRVLIHIAGGAQALQDLAGAPEDDAQAARSAMAAADVGPADCAIALSASGATPYAVAALAEAKDRGAVTISIANNADSPLSRQASIAVVLPTPPELVAGSTRMGAGTAQKIALNMMSTLMAIHLGHVHDGYMVNLRADNLKLKDRAVRIVSAIAGCDEEAARHHIEQAGGSVKIATLLAAGAAGRRAAEELLEASGNGLRAALAQLEGSSRSRKHGT